MLSMPTVLSYFVALYLPTAVPYHPPLRSVISSYETGVKAVESGALIRFSYRILDPQKARILNDKKVEAFLDSPDKRVRLSIPSLEKVGQLRQTSNEEAGRIYWMAFSNPGRPVKPGDRVDIEIGQFHVQGLLVQ